MILFKIRKKSISRAIAILACAISIYAAVILIVERATACGPYLSFRAYLNRSFWLPMFYPADLLLPPGNPGRQAPYAGFSSENAPAALEDLRLAYVPLSIPASHVESMKPFENAMRVASRALAPGVLAGKALEEAKLIDCKIFMRHAESNPEELAAAREKLEQFIASTPNHEFASEARGWLGRIFYLQKDYVRAALIYLDETKSDNSPLNRDTLVNSLRWAYLADEGQIWDRAEEFFDTPRHALFLVNLTTNQRGFHSGSNHYLKERGSRVLTLLNSHPALFKPGVDADALVMALMRTSLFMGDLNAALKYSAAVSKSSALMQNPEFNWMTAIACFIHHDFAAAEAPLLRMLKAPSASPQDRATAAQALVGVYQKTGQKVEALHASFIQNAQPRGEAEADGQHYWQDIISPRMQWCFYGKDLELPYLLDIGLSDADLNAYLKKYPDPVGEKMRVQGWDGQNSFSAPDIVRYSLAVRLARRQEYEEAAKTFSELNSTERAERMQTLAELFARAKDSALPATERLQALFDYADYIASNPNKLFFNDLLWFRMQTYAFFQERHGDEFSRDPHSQPGLTRIERETILAGDRRLRDEQEELWKAFHIFEQVARDAGDTELGQKAAEKIVSCLNGIRVDRFGRKQEISDAISAWKRRLKNVKSL